METVRSIEDTQGVMVLSMTKLQEDNCKPVHTPFS